MKVAKLSFEYEVKGKLKAIEFSPVSYSRLITKELSFGLPQKVKRIFECKSFKMINVPQIQYEEYEGFILNYTGYGYSINGYNLFFHFTVERPQSEPQGKEHQSNMEMVLRKEDVEFRTK